MCSTLGYVQELYTPSKKNSVIVEQLLHHGAVPFVHTNIPQSLVSYGCSNPIYGATTNPYSPERVPGGSSGGEAALIATGGSVFGIGSDVGGSIRIASTFCGISGFKIILIIMHFLLSRISTSRDSAVISPILAHFHHVFHPWPTAGDLKRRPYGQKYNYVY
ncbi:hypothetical protein ANCCAN_28576 [Ancylostoma caninum]|uniref:Amidase domain-containing protein n=1 Tax=Ancylostoma caninum TaxID=29170 RepID=A0A368F3Y0_ANCCA|nr:hypothetical protein ANCCAN_28576 [Ancylostoma caninum]